MQTPKPLLSVGGAPFLEHILWELRRYGFRRIQLLAAFRSEQITNFAAEAGCALGMDVEVVIEPQRAGTGGAIYHARDRLDATFLLLNGDSWFDFNVLDLAACAARLPWADAALSLRRIDEASRYGAIDRRDDRITRFSARPGSSGPGFINGGVYVMRRDSLVAKLHPCCSLEEDVLPGLVDAGRVAGFVYDGYFLDIGVPEAYGEAQTAIPARRRRAAAFLDRDGVLNKDFKHVGSVERFEWCSDAIEAVKRLNDAGVFVFVVTNQAGVAKGFYSEADVVALHGHMQGELRNHGAHFDDIRYCPFHTEGVVAAYARPSNWRKPDPGMIIDLLQHWPVKREDSILFGDKPSDIEAARAAGIRGELVAEGGLCAAACAWLRDLNMANANT